ncbi:MULTISPECIES: GNAT family N-acetyltransferase [Catenuloplanes]|uniref:RimJ/RimL family protein N-acetyltransferase n=1 Tax=Catenuloplanes niger TaxID=587534 RepID=A0AAE4A0D5_9ACTN|nr:GNAT family N-acetyltransferase [Catenuloplanes niger]MDR7328146.1 RimJ/RimL family protein N-acetyltransferase [Catenuloplanes niger]
MTSRLRLSEPVPEDLAEMFALYSDPLVWGPDPLSRHETPEQTARTISNWRAGWARDGHGMWVAREPDGTFAGIGGTFVRYGVAWNLGFRLLPRCWGRGYAQEISAAAREAAAALRPELPMTAYLLEGNDRSRRTVERAGLKRMWRGPDAGNPDPAAIRLLYADRPLDADVIRALTDF